MCLDHEVHRSVNLSSCLLNCQAFHFSKMPYDTLITLISLFFQTDESKALARWAVVLVKGISGTIDQ